MKTRNVSNVSKASNVAKTAYLALAATLIMGAFTGCAGNNTSSGSYAGDNAGTSNSSSGTSQSETGGKKDDLGAITVVSREDGSGTRGAFVELMGIEQKNEAGEKEDMTRADAEINNSTNGVLMSVAGNPSAIGYISLGSLNDSVKAFKVDGVEVSVDNIKAGTYPVARPFNICYIETNLTELDKDFITFITSADGQAIVADKGYIAIDTDAAYTPAGLSGTISCNGSTSVGPVMEVLAAKYEELNPDVKIEVQQTGSGAGITAATEGACQIGMSSRDLKQEELDAGLTPLKIADDGIAVIVNLENPLDSITSEQIMNVYTGSINNWSELG